MFWDWLVGYTISINFCFHKCFFEHSTNLFMYLVSFPCWLFYSLYVVICDPARRNPQKVTEPQSKIQPIFDQWGVIPPSWVFTDYSSRMFISQFPANKITEIDLEVCEKAKIPSTILRLLVRFFLFFLMCFSRNRSFIVFQLSKSITFQQNAWWI